MTAAADLNVEILERSNVVELEALAAVILTFALQTDHLNPRERANVARRLFIVVKATNQDGAAAAETVAAFLQAVGRAGVGVLAGLSDEEGGRV